ncbi:hypothetical protein PybrP1_012459 [[Pythium] brassicae (nom. inval.)]|nr:hypothetical protein PybrP1_012459 [[Pythium] brassicae (nom. inval.)]
MPQFYDAQEDLEAETGRRTSNSGDGSAADTARALGALEVELRPAASAAEPSAGDDKYIVKNKDTGEVYDIRDLSNLPSDSYSIFPNDLLPPLEEEAEAEAGAQTPARSKTRRPSLTKLRIKFPMKGKAREATKRNHVQPEGQAGVRRAGAGADARAPQRHDLDDEVQSRRRALGLRWAGRGAAGLEGPAQLRRRRWQQGAIPTRRDRREADLGAGARAVGHTMPIVDVSWSRSNFILSASMDKTVRLWHISREDCLHVFQHPDSVPAVDFHPKEDRYFLSGCFDNKARVWDIPDGCVVSYVQTPVMITAASFNPGGTRAIVGLLNGQCIFYQVNAHQQMNYYTQIECRNSRGPMKKGRKVTGIEFDPEGKHFMVSTNDSRMRLFSVDNYSRVCKYKGLVNDHLQIKGRFSQDGDFVICGSENGSVYVWNKARCASDGTAPARRATERDRHSGALRPREHLCDGEGDARGERGHPHERLYRPDRHRQLRWLHQVL